MARFLQYYILRNIFIARFMPTMWFMEKKVDISQKKLSDHEREIYSKGLKDGLKWCLCEMCRKYTFKEISEKTERFLKFLKDEKNQNKIATQEVYDEMWNGHYRFEEYELKSFVAVNIQDYRTRLEKARKVHAVNMRLLSQATQLQIE